MKFQAEALYQLQEVDLQIIRHRKRLQEIAAALEDNQAAVAARQEVEQAQAPLAALRSRNRNLDLEIQTNTQKIANAEERLYGGTVKNPKELQDMQQEIASLKKRNLELEDQLLDVMVSLEDAEAILNQAEAQLESVMQAAASDHTELIKEQERLKTELDMLKIRRQTALKPIAADSLKLYDSLKTRKSNQPISSLVNRTCSVCGVEQTMAIAQEVRQGNRLVRCENCDRILADMTK